MVFFIDQLKPWQLHNFLTSAFVTNKGTQFHKFCKAYLPRMKSIDFYNTAYMPYLTLWDKISHNLAHLEASSHKIIKSHRIFRPSYTTFYEEINIKHTVVFITSFLHISKGFWLLWGSFKVIFVKISQNFINSHLKNLPYLTDFSPQLMACMILHRGCHCLKSVWTLWSMR